MGATGRNRMLTVRTLYLATGMLLLAACGNERDRSVTTLHMRPGLTEIGIHVQPISVASGDHVDVLMMDKGQETIVLENVEVLIYDQNDNLVWLAVTKEDAQRVM